IERPQDLEERTTEGGVPGRIRRERGREVRSGEVARRRPQRPGTRAPYRRVLAIALSGRPRAFVGLPNAADRPPELIVELRLPGCDAGIGHSDVRQCEESRQAQEVSLHLVGDRQDDLVVEAWRRAQAWG